MPRRANSLTVDWTRLTSSFIYRYIFIFRCVILRSIWQRRSCRWTSSTSSNLAEESIDQTSLHNPWYNSKELGSFLPLSCVFILIFFCSLSPFSTAVYHSWLRQQEISSNSPLPLQLQPCCHSRRQSTDQHPLQNGKSSRRQGEKKRITQET